MASAMGMAVASLVITATSAVASGIQSYQQGKAQDAYNRAQADAHRKAWEQNSKATAQEYANQSAAERVAQMQEKEKASTAIQDAQKEALQKAGTMMASTNAAGGTLNFLLNDYARQEAQATEKFRTQYEMAATASDFTVQSYMNKAQNRLDSQGSYTYMNSGASLGNLMLTTALGLGQAGLNSAQTYHTYK